MSKLNNVPLVEFGRGIPPKVTPPTNNPLYPHLLGVELELEDSNVTSTAMPAGWDFHEDGSLRNGAELVLRNPLNGNALLTAIAHFYNKRYTYTAGPRTSTHIHVNMSEDNVGLARRMFVLTYMVEDALFAAVEEKRKYAGYCMALSEMNPQRIRDFLTTDDRRTFRDTLMGRNTEKYYGFNINSIHKHGTVEFRYFTGGPRKPDLLDWIAFVNELKTAAINTQMDELVSLGKPEDVSAFVMRKFPTWGQRLLEARGAESMMNSLDEVASYIVDGDAPTRRDPLVFVTPSLLRFVKARMLYNDAQRAYLDDSTRGLSVLTVADWQARVQSARAYVERDTAARPLTGATFDFESYNASTMESLAQVAGAYRAPFRPRSVTRGFTQWPCAPNIGNAEMWPLAVVRDYLRQHPEIDANQSVINIYALMMADWHRMAGEVNAAPEVAPSENPEDEDY